MELIQITANFPGKGNVNVLASPDLATAKQMLDEKDTPNGDLGYRLGSAFLVPYPNRIRGKLSADGKTLTTSWEGHTITLPANNIGKNADAERHAMHGLILKAKTDDVHVKDIPGGQEVTGVIHAGDFGGHWLSKTDLDMTITLTADAVDASIVAHNVGSEAEPIAIGWHPYFALPSGDRTQVRIHIPATNYAGRRQLRQRISHGADQACRWDAVRSARSGRRGARAQLLRRQLEQARLEQWRGHGDGDRSGGASTAWTSSACRRRSRPSRCTRRQRCSLSPSKTSSTLPILLARSGARWTPAW